MTVARRQQISLDQTPYYHCTSRCVRRAFLCGQDRYTGKSFSHRRQWLEARLVYLSAVFALDLLAYAIMENHYHVVVRLNAEQVAGWSEAEVKARWARLYPQSADGRATPPVERWRARLLSLSWFMRCVNEPLARLANREDRCKGRFWEGRFKSQALLDETALLKCLCYVDLNPIRASISTTQEGSHHTSIKARLEGRHGHLLPFGTPAGIPFHWRDYLELVDWSGRALRPDRHGAIPSHLPPILARTGLEAEHWIQEMRYYGRWYYRAVGSAQALARYCSHLGQKWLKGSAKLTPTPV